MRGRPSTPVESRLRECRFSEAPLAKLMREAIATFLQADSVGWGVL